MQMIEALKGFDHQYFIDADGNVYRKLTPNRNPQGYMRLGLRVKGKRKWFNVHRLVAETFLANDGNKPFVNHIDGDKSNNRLENLEWCDQSENMTHAFRTGLKAPSHPKSVRQYTLDGKFVKQFASREEAARSVRAFGSNINKAVRYGRACAGYLWKDGDSDA